MYFFKSIFPLCALLLYKVKTRFFMCIETNSNNGTPTTTTTTGKGKKKKGGGSKKSTTENPENSNTMISKQHSSNETSKQSLDLMEAMMDDFCVDKSKGSERSSISHSFSVDDSTACDLAIELNPKKRVTRAQARK